MMAVKLEGGKKAPARPTQTLFDMLIGFFIVPSNYSRVTQEQQKQTAR